MKRIISLIIAVVVVVVIILDSVNSFFEFSSLFNFNTISVESSFSVLFIIFKVPIIVDVGTFSKFKWVQFKFLQESFPINPVSSAKINSYVKSSLVLSICKLWLSEVGYSSAVYTKLYSETFMSLQL